MDQVRVGGSLLQERIDSEQGLGSDSRKETLCKRRKKCALGVSSDKRSGEEERDFSEKKEGKNLIIIEMKSSGRSIIPEGSE